MDKKTKGEIKKIIEMEIEDIIDEIEYLEEATKPVAPDCSIGRVTRMEALSTKSVNEALLENAQTKLSLLEKNLRKIDTESFGLCIECSEPIPVNRLKAVPETQKCVKCSHNR